MCSECIGGVVKTIMDGLKDARLQLDWAVEAHRTGEPELARMHLEEARKRLAGVKDWYRDGYALLGKQSDDDVACALEEHQHDVYDALMHRVDRMAAMF